MMEDNDKKIKYLAEMLKKYLATNDVKVVNLLFRKLKALNAYLGLGKL